MGNSTFRTFIVVPLELNAEVADDVDETEPRVHAPVLCVDEGCVVRACMEFQTKGFDWSVWEYVNGKFEMKSVNFELKQVR